MAGSAVVLQLLCVALLAGCASTTAEASIRKIIESGQLNCDALGKCDHDRTVGGGILKSLDAGRTLGRKLLQGIVGQIICDTVGNCDDGRGRRYYDENRDDRRRGGDWNRGDDYNRGNYYRGEGDRRDWGRRKLQQGVVGQIVCDALGNCDDGRGNRYYDGNRDERRRGGYNNGGDYNNDNRGGNDNRGNDNRGYGK